jgi:HPt (histidine-containing phosphotransfer) domain-containing protein
MKLSPRAQELLARQQAKYMRSLPEKKARIAHCWSAIKRQGWAPELSDKLKTEVHRLSGSAPSYGLEALGQAAHKLDLLLASGIDIDAADTESGELMSALFHAFDEVIDGTV